MKRRLNSIFGWVVLVLYTAVFIYVIATWQTWPPAAIPIGIVALLMYCAVVVFVWGGVRLVRSRESLEPTEWMRRGGLMASPEASARPDEARIRFALSAIPR